ncbi:MAG: Tryptophan RNA-binding attenuator protein MtrB [Thermoanaerobacterales bacterium 50_218]|nr:MAG: Tryptophan RNA-binding attenuator protein MtrB [Thermoanaerobacterales bacterium 50_218]HAA90073.1 trp RNA-binding attenuation protein MtrB [Peptococcaceae bacterium]
MVYYLIQEKKGEAKVIEPYVYGDYIAIKALENGVTVIGLTRGKDTKLHHTEKLDRGEVIVAQFTEHTAAIKVRGKAVVYTKFGSIETSD